MINISVDGIVQKFPKGVMGLEVAQQMNVPLFENVLGVIVNGRVWDITRSIQEDSVLEWITWEEVAGKQLFWHSSAHLMAEALITYYPNIKFGIGPPIERGFYYDVDFGTDEFDTSHLETIESNMLRLASQNNTFQRIEVSKEEAVLFFEKKNNPYKLELLEGLQEGDITFYKQGSFIDLCKGPHIPHTGFVKAVKLLNVAGAYWRGNEKNKQLTRIYGITFPSKSDLDVFLMVCEEGKKRNHKKLGKELGLFTFSEKVGLGLPLWLPHGAILREKLSQFLVKIQIKLNYQPVITPHIGHKNLYVTSGHYEKYGEDSFQPIHTTVAGEEYLLKPMNCPHHCEIYNSEIRSYKDLPLRFSEFGTVYRYEQHGALHGLTRTRCFTQDDAHIFCRSDQVQEEFAHVIDLVLYVFNIFNFTDYVAQISLRDHDSKKYIGSEADWNAAEQAIEEVARYRGLKIQVIPGEAAFYGPKLDFMVKDVLGRNWQLGTVQLDYQLPARFNLTYIGSDSQKHQPVMIHRAPFGSLERFIAILIEHTGGVFPLWLAPEQVSVLPISEHQVAYANRMHQLLIDQEIRSVIDPRNEKIGRKIRDAALRKIPYILIIGEKEVQNNKITVRTRGKEGQESVSIEYFIDLMHRCNYLFPKI